jgi:DNA-binding response OmpR family regulator
LILYNPDLRSDPVAADEDGFVLLVEDDAMLSASLAEALGCEGYRVECAANGVDALQRLERAPRPSLILLDVMMPYMDGLEFRLLQRAIRDVADIPVIVITAVGMRREIARELALEQTFFKPLDMRALLASLRQHLRPAPGHDRPVLQDP